MNAGKFRDKYLDREVFSGPFINGGDGRYAVEMQRKWLTVADLLQSDDLFTAKMGKHVMKSMKKTGRSKPAQTAGMKRSGISWAHSFGKRRLP